MTGLSLNLGSLGLLPFPIGIKLIVTIELPAPHLHEMHVHTKRQMTFINYNYQFVAESRKRLQELAIGDEVLIRVHLERVSLETLKTLHTRRNGLYKVLRRFGFSAYELDILCDLRISPMLSIET